MARKSTVDFVSCFVYLHLLPYGCARPETPCDKGQKLAKMLLSLQPTRRIRKINEVLTSSFNKIYSFINLNKFFDPLLFLKDIFIPCERCSPRETEQGGICILLSTPYLVSLSSHPRRNCYNMVSHLASWGTATSPANEGLHNQHI